MPVPIGLSFGDIVAGVKLIHQVYRAIQDAGGAADEYQALVSELGNLRIVFDQLRAVSATSNVSQNHYNAIRGLLGTLERPIQDFQDEVRKFDQLLCSHESNPGVWPSRAKKRVQWALRICRKVKELRAAMVVKLHTIELLLLVPQGELLSGIRDLGAKNRFLADQMKKSFEDLTNKFKTQNEENQQRMERQINAIVFEINESQAASDIPQQLKDIDGKIVLMGEALNQKCNNLSAAQEAHKEALTKLLTTLQALTSGIFLILISLFQTVTSAKEDFLKYFRSFRTLNLTIYLILLEMQQNLAALVNSSLPTDIRLIDGIHHPHRLPFVYFQHWEVFEPAIIRYFQGRPGEQKVRHRKYLISDVKNGAAISAEDWSRVVYPGAQLDMSMILSAAHVDRQTCPKPGCDGEVIHETDHANNKCGRCGLLTIHSTVAIPASDMQSSPQINSLTSSEPSAKVWLAQPTRATADPDRALGIDWKSRSRFLTAVKSIGRFLSILRKVRQREGNELRAFRKVFIPASPIILYLEPLNRSFEAKAIIVPFYPGIVRIRRSRRHNPKITPTPQDGYFESPVVSRDHAEVWADRNGRIWISDTQSRNGTYINGQRLQDYGMKPRGKELVSGDVLELGLDFRPSKTSAFFPKISARVTCTGS